MKISKVITVIFLSLIVTVLPGPGHAHQVDGIEHLFGATNINAAVGNGGLTVGLSREGEITLLRWPSPSYYDQINYRTAIVGVNEGYHARDLQHMGARADMGAFAGVFVRKETDFAKMLWFRDKNLWEITQGYLTDDDNIIVNQYVAKLSEFSPFGITQQVFVHPDRDVLVVHFSGWSPESAKLFRLIYYANLAPCLQKQKYYPLLDWIDDSQNDFAAVYDADHDAIIQFTYSGAELEDLLDYIIAFPYPTDDEVSALLEGLPELTRGKEAVFVATGFLEGNDAYQVGYDMNTGCPTDTRYDPYLEEPPYIPKSAFAAAESGNLPGEKFSHCTVNFALARDVNAGEYWEATLIMAFGSSYNEAVAALEWAREKGYTSLISETQTYWRDWVSKARLPDTEDEKIIAFSKRALISIKTAMDRDTGAIVASVSTQPPYNLDWPRDGAFINAALDIAGYVDMATLHNNFYIDVQRKNPQFTLLVGSRINLEGTFEMNYYADGMPGGPIFFEIDETGLAVWTLWNHA